ncbi:MAG: RnfABCDGE type electron transport complex subunit B [Clostridiales bacterium]|jgi:electron transport complex protein RnfB|nr:RnfABCDGE type electron transport complex subunit B [Clostridiales bacterium]
MNPILLAVLIVAGLGLAAGLVLAVASVVMAVPRDEKTEALRACLPGANCGACGYSGCDGYAKAMAHEGAKVGLCSPGGEQVAAATAELLGVSGSDLVAQTALVRCGGCEEFTARKLRYEGIPTCAAANQFYGGDWLCNYGCLGYGDCRTACEYGAIKVENGLSRIDPALCRGCGLCVKACPKSLITLLPGGTKGVVRCSSHEKGALVRKACKVGCIGCMKCTKACQYDAIHVEKFLASIDPEKCVGCGACAETCPTGCITIFGKEKAVFEEELPAESQS